jgi:hypothetical protein
MKYRVALALAVSTVVGAGLLRAEDPAISDEQLAQLHRVIKPGPGESRWMEIDWYPSVWEARRRAAAEGKPLFLWAGSGGAPAAGC